MIGVGVVTASFWIVRDALHKGQASLLYLPLVIACAVRLGFGPAVLASALSFFCWNFFFLPPAYTLHVTDQKDWLSLGVFLVTAITTSQLASRAQAETALAQAREREAATLFAASEAISREVRAERLLAALAAQFQALCHASHCLVLRRAADGTLWPVFGDDVPIASAVRAAAERACTQDEVTGLDMPHPDVPGAFVPLHAAESLVGVLHIGPREDGTPYTPSERRVILTLAHHAATILAREALAEQAAQAAALREADALKEALLSLVSHELRTPLAAIKASATGLLQPDAHWDERSRHEAMAAIDREADRLTGVVNNLLDLSRLQAGGWQPAKDWCELGDVLSTALDRLPEATANRVQACLCPDLPLIRADYAQLVLVLENLLGNAAKYAPSGPITVGATRSDRGVTLFVRDVGPGFADDERERVFARFYRGERHRRSAIHGTGLGLALCQAIVHAHGGTIVADNAPDGGAVLTVVLPADAAGKGDDAA